MKKILGLFLLASVGQVYANTGWLHLTNYTGGWIYVDINGGKDCSGKECTIYRKAGNTSHGNVEAGATAEFQVKLLTGNHIHGMNVYSCKSYNATTDDCERGPLLTHLEFTTGSKAFGDGHNPATEIHIGCSGDLNTNRLKFGGDYYDGLRAVNIRNARRGICTDVDVDLLPPQMYRLADSMGTSY